MKKKNLDPISISKLKRTKFYKGLYAFFDKILPNPQWPLLGKLSNKIRVGFFRKISPSVSKKICIYKGCEIYPSVIIEDDVVIGANCHLNWCLTIKKGTKIAKDVYFNTQNHKRDPITKKFDGLTDINPIVVGEYCWIGTKSIVLGGVTIGDYSTIGAASVVTKPIPDCAIAVGNPAVVKKTI